MIDTSYDEIREEADKPVKQRKEYITARGNKNKPRRHHMTEKVFARKRDQWVEDTVGDSQRVKDNAGDKFFNPYMRSGAYYGSIQALYLLGANEWHTFSTVVNKMENFMKTVIDIKNKNSWSKFSNKASRKNRDGCVAIRQRDMIGRIIENFEVLQRMGGKHPYALKLKQVCACIDIINEGESIRYRLNTDFALSEDVKCSFLRPAKKRGRKKKVMVEETVVEKSKAIA